MKGLHKTFSLGFGIRAVILGCIQIASVSVMAADFDWDKARTGVHISSVDLDNVSYDDTVGVGAYSEVPYSDRIKFGAGFDYWATEYRNASNLDITNFVVGTYAKYFFIPYAMEFAPYGLAGVGFHFTEEDFPGDNDREQSLSLDMGIGGEARISSYISLVGEIKHRTMEDYDYADYSVGAVAKF